jgi:hypothetical protein
VDYYDFTVDGARVGYFEVEERPGELYLNARLSLGGVPHENPFWLRHARGIPTQVKVRDSGWRDVPVGTFPTSAYPLVIRSGLARYRAFVEGTGAIEEREMRSEAGLIKEHVGETVVRSFGLDGSRITYVCWGGTAESRLVGSRAEAVAGTAFE